MTDGKRNGRPVVLVLDADAARRLEVASWGDEDGYRTEAVSTAREGLGLLSSHRPDCILVGSKLADASADETVERVRGLLGTDAPPVVDISDGTTDKAIRARVRKLARARP